MRPGHVQRYIDRFEELGPDSLGSLVACFSDAARFVDPFNDVRGTEAIRQVFEHMFATCDGPRFEVDECVGEDATYYLRWRFSFGREGSRRTLHGVSRVQFGPDGLVLEHTDYWDPASQLYEKIPILGGLLRALRRRLSAPQTKQTTTGTPNGVPPATQR